MTDNCGIGSDILILTEGANGFATTDFSAFFKLMGFESVRSIEEMLGLFCVSLWIGGLATGVLGFNNFGLVLKSGAAVLARAIVLLWFGDVFISFAGLGTIELVPVYVYEGAICRGVTLGAT